MVSSVSNSFLSNNILQLLGKSKTNLAANSLALASGNRLKNAYTDIAALSIATSLQANVSALRSTSQNITEALSFLQVADGGITQIQAMSERMQQLATQATSGALSANDRKSLDKEFQSLKNGIDQIAKGTSFSGVNLLDGSLGNSNNITTSATVASKAAGSLTFTGNIAAGETVKLNGVTLTEGIDFNASGSTSQTISNLATALKNSNNQNLSGFSFAANGNSLAITAKAAGTAGNQFTIDETGSTANFVTGGDDLSGAGIYSLTGGKDAGISAGDVKANGTIANNLLTSNNGKAASTELRFNNSGDIQAGDTIQISNGEGGFTTFTFTAGAPVAATDIQIGNNLEKTLQNTAKTINNYQASDDYGTRQLSATISGNNIKLSGKVDGNVNDVSGNPITVNLNTSGGQITNNSLNNGSKGGIDTSGVTNSEFKGKIQGFTASMTGNDSAKLSLKVGAETYTAQISDTTPAGDSNVRFTSQNGGYFDVTLKAGQGQSVNSSFDAKNLANKFDDAFSNLNFTQNRDVSNFRGSGQLMGANLQLQDSNFSNISASSVSVNSGIGGNASLEIKAGGETYRSASGMGTSIGAGEKITLTSTSNPEHKITFINGNSNINLTTNNDAKNLQTALENDLGLNDNNKNGTSTGELKDLAIDDLSSASLFGGQNLNLLSSDAAAQAKDVLAQALHHLTAQRSNVGSFSEALNYNAAQVESSLINQTYASDSLSNTDVGIASTLQALYSIQQKSQIANLAQSKNLQSNLLKLLVG